MNQSTNRKIFVCLVTMLLFIFSNCSPARHEQVIFFGDSITELGVEPNGYVTLIANSLKKTCSGRNIKVIGAGVSGNKVPDLEARLQEDVLSKRPMVVIIYIGINDVWHSILPGQSGTPEDEFENGLQCIIQQLKEIDSKIILCTLSVVGEQQAGTNQLDTQLDEYTAICKKVAKEEKLYLVDLRKEFQNYLKTHNPDNLDKGILTYDGVHLNDKGNKFVSEIILKVLAQLF